MMQPIPLPDLLKFLGTAGEKGWIKPQTAEPMRKSCERVLGALEAEQQIDVSGVDVDQAIRQYANLHSEVSSVSLASYASRIRSAIRMFAEMKANPTTWKPPAGRASNGSKTAAKSAGDEDKAAVTAKTIGGSGEHVTPASAMEGLSRGLSYPFPIRADSVVTISNLPRDLKKTEAARLGAFIAALAMEE